MKRTVFGLALIFILSSCTLPGSSSSGTKKVAATAPAYKITAEALLKEYRTNQVAADNKYKGKVIQITGRIDEIGKSLLTNEPQVVFPDKSGVDSISCSFDKSQSNKLLHLKSGDIITVKGLVRRYGLGVLLLKNCVY